MLPKAILEELGPNLARYTILEGSQEIIEAFRSEVTLPASTELLHSLFEDYQPAETFDAIEMGFVLDRCSQRALASPATRVIVEQFANGVRLQRAEMCIELYLEQKQPSW